MRNRIFFILSLSLLLMLFGCSATGSTSNKVPSPASGVTAVLEQGMANADRSTDSDSLPPANDSADITQDPVISDADLPISSSDGIDVDLTVMSSTMVYSEVYNMMESPEEYIGKTVKMKGLFSFYHDETTDNYYFACIIQDATACCAQGLEFVLSDGYRYPDDFPEEGTEISVVGVFDTYEEEGYTYCTLRDANLV